MNSDTKGQVVVISGPSGVGKSTIVKKLLELASKRIAKSISATTRKMRTGETNGKEYFFLTRSEFENGIKQGRFIEHAIIYGEYYGTPKEKLLEMLSQGKNVILEIDMQGAKSIKSLGIKGLFIFLLPPTLEDLERRLSSRGEEESSAKKRLESVKAELAESKSYDLSIFNDSVDDAVEDIKHALKERGLWD